MSARRIVDRVAAKVIVVDFDDAVLLFRGGDPARPDEGTWWFPPGGGVEPGESIGQAAWREVYEETGLGIEELGPVVLRRNVEFTYKGVRYRSDEHYFIVCAHRFEVNQSRWTRNEAEVIEEHRWWPIRELRVTKEVVYPEDLVTLVEAHL
jgi:8-oxo-dGTP pyrophosphatase MutT (NUDIX family)